MKRYRRWITPAKPFIEIPYKGYAAESQSCKKCGQHVCSNCSHRNRRRK